MIYCYQCPTCGRKTELVRAAAQRNVMPKCDVCGRVCVRDQGSELRGSVKNTLAPTGNAWRVPLRSNAMAVSPTQCAEAERYDRSLGVPTHYCRTTGCPEFTSRSHRREWNRAHGVVDRDGGWSD